MNYSLFAYQPIGFLSCLPLCLKRLDQNNYNIIIQIFQIIMSQPRLVTLEEYKIQRQYREDKRKQYLLQFQSLRSKLCTYSINQAPSDSQKNPQPSELAQDPLPQATSVNSTDDQSELLLQNQKLRNKLVEIEATQRQKLGKFKQQMQKAKNIYISKVKQLRQAEVNKKKQNQQRIKKLQQQVMISKEKNKEIEEINTQTEKQSQQADLIMQKYTNEIRDQYDKKLLDFNAIFTASSQKISNMEDQYNEDQFVETTLQNQELIQSIRQNVEKAEDIEKIVEDYKELLQGKTQILEQLSQNNKMKEEEIAKMATLEGKLKLMCEKLNEEKKIYLTENKRMAEQLLQIKQLLSKAMGSQ